MWDKSRGLIGQKRQNTFQYTQAENFLVDTRQAGDQASGFLSSDTFHSFG